MSLFSLAAKLALDSSEYEKGLDDAENKASGFGSKLKSGLATAGKVGAAAIGAVTTATVALTKTVVSGASEVASYGDTIDKESQKLGMSAEAYQEWDAILQHSGSSVQALSGVMRKLNANLVEQSNAIQEGAYDDSNALAQLGFSMEEVADMADDPDKALKNIISKLQQMPASAKRTELATELLGKSQAELAPLLNTSAEDTEAMRQAVHDLGGVMSDDAVKASAAFQDSLQDMKTSIDGAKRNIMSQFLPSITGIMDGLTMLFSGNAEGGIGKIKQGIGDFINNLTENIPKILEVGIEIVKGLLTAITENLPELISAGTEAVLLLIQGVIENLPAIVDAGIQALGALINGIVQSLPQLIPAIIEAILLIVETLTEPDNIMMLIDGTIQLMLGMVQGIVKAIPTIVEHIPEIIVNIIQALIAAIPEFIKAGIQLLAGLGQGLIDGVTAVVEKAKEVAGKVVDAVKNFFGISSPSKVFKQFGVYLDKGLAEGIDGAMGEPTKAMSQLSEEVADAFDPDFSMSGANTPVVTGGSGKSSSYTEIPVSSVNGGGGLGSGTEGRSLTVILELDRIQFARAVYQLNNEEVQRVGVRLAGGYS